MNRPVPAALPESSGSGAVAPEAERAHIGEVAFAAAFHDGHDVIGIPEVPAAAPFFFEPAAGSVVELSFVLAECLSIQAALGANAAVAGEDLFSQVGGIGAQLPRVDAGGAAKCESAAGDFGGAPAARAALPLDPTAGLDATSAHTRSS